ncbi:MAG: diacylglycerol kinase family lipid kinase [Firmicutes bacterium]|nr:diacylglycerol kinase family lipid kinase [Bacillota bacterium]
MSIAIIVNPLAGRGRGAKTADLAQQILKEQNVDFELTYTKNPEHAVELAAKASRNHEVIAALGGDGTTREVLEGMWKTSSVLGIIPGGTGNDYARSLRIPLQTKQALEVLKKASTVPLDVGLAGERIFGVLCSIGFPVDVIEHVNAHRRGLLKGSLAILAGVASTIRHLKTHPVQITVDGTAFKKQIAGLFVMNMPYGGGGLKFTPEAKPNNKVFHVFILDQVSRIDLALTLPKVYSGRHLPHPAITIVEGEQVEVESGQLPIMLDGDVFQMGTLRARIAPHATRVIVPQA